MSYSNIKSLPNHLEEMFSATHTISAMAYEIDEWKKGAPENKYLAVRMRTVEGEMMRVQVIKPTGFQLFTAIGMVNDKAYMITGHISTLRISCHLEDITEGEDIPDFSIQSTESIQ